MALKKKGGSSDLVISNDYEGTGGSDYTVLGDEFLTTDDNYFCDESLWKLKSGESSTMMTYSSSTELGQTFQYDVVPTGINAANIVHGRSSLYQIVIGNNSFKHLSVQDLRTDEFVGLKSLGGVFGDSGRIDMGFNLSTSTENTVRIFENRISDIVFQLVITVNNKMFISQEMKVIDYDKKKTIYLALLDGSDNLDNNTGLLAPELRICK